MSTTPKKRPEPDTKPDTRPDRNLMRKHLSKLVYPDSCFEIRIIHAKFDFRTGAIVESPSQFATIGGYYQDPEVALSDLNKVEDISVYVVENPIRKSLYSRFNKDKLCSIGKGQGTEDEHIDWLIRILIDMDSIRDTGISATDAELRPVLDRQDYLLGHEPEIRAASIWGCSGNGGWITADCKPISCINPDPDDDTWVHPSHLVKHFLTSLSLRYSTNLVDIDCKVFNPSRIGPLAGTYKCKGAHSDERPWRQVSLDSPERPVTLFGLADYCAAHPLPEAASNGKPRARKKGRIVVPPTLVDTNGAPLSPPVPPSGEDANAESTDPNMVMPEDTEDYDDNRIRRAWAYAAKKEISREGHDGSGKLRSICHDMLWGFGLTQSEATPIINVWNRKCEGPWDWNEIQHAFDRAEETGDNEGRPRGYRLDERNGVPVGPVGPFTCDEPHANGDGTCCEVDPTNREEKRPASPSILWNPKEMDANEKVIPHLRNFKGLYQKDYMLVEIVQENSQHEKIKYLEVPAGTPMIMAVNSHRLREILSSLITFTMKFPNRVIPQVTYTPDRCVKAIHSRTVWPGVPRLIGVVEHPVIRPDGSITDKPGYDQDTGMMWHGDPIDPVPENPTLEDAKDAAEEILELVSEFEFEDSVSKCVWLSCLLTIVGRHLVNGNVPLFYFDASTSGSGKSLLCDVISCITTGRQMTRTAYHHDSVEMDKRLVSTLLAGLRVTMLDNIEGDFGNSALDNVLTARYYSGRLLGHNKMSPALLVDTTFVATANNATFCGDLFRRQATCRLVSSCERPDQERTKFKIKELEKYAIANRPRLLCRTLTILRAYIQAGCPCELATNVYGDWTRMIRGAIKWTLDIDPWEHRVKAVQSDSKRSGNAALLEGFAEMMSITRKDHLTTSEIVRALRTPDAHDTYTIMYDAVMEVWNCRNGQIPSASAIGNRLGRMNMTRYGNRRIFKKEDSHTKLSLWYLQEFDESANKWFDLEPEITTPNAGDA